MSEIFLCGERELFEGHLNNKPVESPNLRFIKDSTFPQIELTDVRGFYFNNLPEAFDGFYNRAILNRVPENLCEPAIYDSCLVGLDSFLFFYDQEEYERNPKFDEEAKLHTPYLIRGDSCVLRDGYRIIIQGTCHLKSILGSYLFSFFNEPLPILTGADITLTSVSECTDFSHKFATVGIRPGLFQVHKIKLD
ncbi:MAG TPA: hypothetical protein ENI07_16600 [Desulfobacterales bacterium]|nr:hypothetical protein [Desulfobacterales bacterium]